MIKAAITKCPSSATKSTTGTEIGSEGVKESKQWHFGVRWGCGVIGREGSDTVEKPSKALHVIRVLGLHLQ